MSDMKLAQEAKKFLNSMQQTLRFAQAVADYELNEAMIEGAKGELDHVKNQVLAAKDDLAAKTAAVKLAEVLIKQKNDEATKIIDTANAVAAEHFAQAQKNAEHELAAARAAADAIMEAKTEQVAARDEQIKALDALIDERQKELAKLQKALADLKKKFG